jgi:hypothetical protein
VGALATLPANRKACYAVNISATDIVGTPASTCSPKTGIVKGFVEAGQTIDVLVPKGAGRKIELYLFLGEEGASAPCPVMNPVLTPAQLLNTYLVGTASDIAVQGETQTVEITASFPGVTNYLAQTLSMPATCTAGSVIAPGANPKGLYLTSGMTTAAGTTMKLKARIGSISGSGQVLTGSGHKLIVK